jgi:hypothetical protein
MVLTTIKSFFMALLSHCVKNSANGMANRPAEGGITLDCAHSRSKDAQCSRPNRRVLLNPSDCCRLDCSTSQRFRAKFLAHTNSYGFSDAGFCHNAKPDPDCHSKRPNAH